MIYLGYGGKMRISFGVVISTAAVVTFLMAAIPAFAQSVYVESTGTDALGRFGILDLATGSYQFLGARSERLSGLALSSNGILYGSGVTFGSTITSQLYTVNPANGQVTLLGNIGATGSQVTSITFASDGSLYGLLSSPNGAANLIRIGNLTGPPTTATPVSLPFSSNGAIAGDASGNLYATQGEITPSGFGGLFRFGTSGEATTSLSEFEDALFNAPVYAMSFTAGTLFAIDNGTGGTGASPEGGIYSVDRSSGIATQTASYNTSTVGNVFAATNVIVVPETGTAGLILPGLALLATASLAKRRRSR